MGARRLAHRLTGAGRRPIVGPTPVEMPSNRGERRSMSATPKVKGRRTRAEQRAATVKQILDTAEDLFARLGYFGVTIKDVADRMGIHAALIHYYFDGKKALFDGVFQRRVEYAISARTAALDAYEKEAGDHPTVEGALRAYYDGAFDVYINGDEGWRNFGRIFAQVNNAPGYGAEKMDTYFDPLVLRDRIERMLGQRDLWRKPSMSVRSVLGVLNQAAEALDLDRRVDLAEPGDPETELR